MKIQNDAKKKINETKYKHIFDLESDNHTLGLCFKEIYDNILEVKKKREIGNDLKLMLKLNMGVDLSIDMQTRTEKDLDNDACILEDVNEDGY
jgi:hypothetical protein